MGDRIFLRSCPRASLASSEDLLDVPALHLELLQVLLRGALVEAAERHEHAQERVLHVHGHGDLGRAKRKKGGLEENKDLQQLC